MIEDLRLKDWDHFLAALRLGQAAGLDDGGHAFRGGCDATRELLPSIGRFRPYDEARERYTQPAQQGTGH